MEQLLPLRIILSAPTPGVDFGVQKGTGTVYEVVQKQRSTGKDLVFEISIKIKPGTIGSPVFVGPLVHGPASERFIYIDIGKCAGQVDSPWQRRLKIPLKLVSAALLQDCLSSSASVLECHVAGTGKDGGPNCATVKPFEGWQVKPS